jgi:hypothetical protein
MEDGETRNRTAKPIHWPKQVLHTKVSTPQYQVYTLQIKLELWSKQTIQPTLYRLSIAGNFTTKVAVQPAPPKC